MYHEIGLIISHVPSHDAIYIPQSLFTNYYSTSRGILLLLYVEFMIVQPLHYLTVEIMLSLPEKKREQNVGLITYHSV